MFLISLPICRAEFSRRENGSVLSAPDNATSARHMEWRRALIAQFPYEPANLIASAELPESVQQTPLDLDIIILEPFNVGERRIKFSELDKALRSQEENARVEALSRKLGTGSHAYTFGHRRFSVEYGSIFYIPVSAGFSW